ncbi:MAG: rhodanese-like domain-containing protein [Clostridia bacterium]|jgi:phage shock protein E|nr:rhodanese-like domain-containing protein [Clostridia bacterium]
MKVSKLKYKIKNFFKKSFYRNVNSITYLEAKEIIKKENKTVLLDVRSLQEYREYHLAGGICIPLYELNAKIQDVIQDKDIPIIIYCQTGSRSNRAVKILKELEYENIYEIKGGLDNL